MKKEGRECGTAKANLSMEKRSCERGLNRTVLASWSRESEIIEDKESSSSSYTAPSSFHSSVRPCAHSPPQP